MCKKVQTLFQFTIQNSGRLFAVVVLLLYATLALAQNDQQWVGSWSSAQQTSDSVFSPESPTYDNVTLRQIVRVTKGGSTLRVRLSNVLGTDSVTIGAVTVALRDTDSSIVESTLTTLTFGGSPSVTIPDGAKVLSDPVSLTINDFDDLAISMYVPAATVGSTTHNAALQTNYISSEGDHTAAVNFPTENTVESWYWLSGVEVLASSDTKVIAAIGDSITDGTSSTADTNNRWPNLLALRLASVPGDFAVLNLGIAGNRVLHSVIGPNAQARFDRDVLTQSGVTHVVVLEGINDIGLPALEGFGFEAQSVTADDIIGGYRQLIRRAHTAGLKIIGATLTPFENALYYTEEGEAKRQAVNAWIRSSGEYDDIIDFDQIIRNPDNELQMLPAYDSGDFLHPGDAGYQAMADGIDLAIFGVGGAGSCSDVPAGGLRFERYDATQAELFWARSTGGLFSVYRDGELVSSGLLNGTSFYQADLVAGQSYEYEVYLVDAQGKVLDCVGTVTVPRESGNTNGNLSGVRYDATQAEIFWTSDAAMFNVYRDGLLAAKIDGRSYYQNDLIGGQSYIYEVRSVDASGSETSLGTVEIPGTAR